jgi:predicted Holliday junction resolvase-like endonuclease
MSSEITDFFALQRKIFGVCPKCNNLFRLSDCKIFSDKKPLPDWMDKIDLENQRLDEIEQEISEKEQEVREKEREKGRLLAQKAVKKVDPVFAPRKLHADDAKVLFHPIDFIVFDGMNSSGKVDDIVLLDKYTTDPIQRKIQKSIEQTIKNQNYEWQTVRVGNDGNIAIE